jgi:hypothetical protein
VPWQCLDSLALPTRMPSTVQALLERVHAGTFKIPSLRPSIFVSSASEDGAVRGHQPRSGYARSACRFVEHVEGKPSTDHLRSASAWYA